MPHFVGIMGKMMTIRTYTELSKLKTFEERLNYLMIGGKVGQETFGRDRYLNQILYHTDYWNNVVRPAVIARDCGYDLGVYGCEIVGSITIHHMNPVRLEDVLNHDPIVFDPEFLITTATAPTHRAIHYGDLSAFNLIKPWSERKPNDTCPWKR